MASLAVRLIKMARTLAKITDPRSRLDPNNDPMPCYGCGDRQKPGQKYTLVKMDLDPGDAEVGPKPEIANVGLCPSCFRLHKNNKKLPFEEDMSTQRNRFRRQFQHRRGNLR